MTSFDLQKNEQTCQTFRENIENEKGKEFQKDNSSFEMEFE